MELKPIGIIHSPYQDQDNTPRQGFYSEEPVTLEIYPEYTEGLRGIDELTQIVVLYWGDRSDRNILLANPPHSMETVGVFVSRSPARPNPILMNIAHILRIEGSKVIVKGMDALDGSPLLDIKPHISPLKPKTQAKKYDH